MHPIDIIAVILLALMTNLITVSVVTDSKNEVLNKIEAPVYIQCYKKSSLDETSTMMHRIQCPMEVIE